ncbi:MAG: DUF309 domain-containing protein [Gammaproteobacteria bacterium]|nr:DUF309 domain-containing protein [Gammaproteobacteria bacterium]
MSSALVFDALAAHAPPRYTAFTLPPYRFVPRRQPHPTADPRGHSYGRAPPYEAAPMDGHRWRASPAYLFGCDLYNRGYWWEAHEAWESIWQLADREGPERAALQGLIQLANCHLKLHMGLVNVVPRLQRRYGAHFDRAVGLVGMPFLGLDLPAYRSRADAYLHAVTARADPAHDPVHYPYLRLPVGRSVRSGDR